MCVGVCVYVVSCILQWGGDEEVREEDKQQDMDRVEVEGARGKGC